MLYDDVCMRDMHRFLDGTDMHMVNDCIGWSMIGWRLM
jgi:hypothetical protein